MKRIINGFVCVAVMGLSFTTALSQGITISASDVAAMFASGTTTTYRGDTLTTTADIGAPGASSWDFSALNTHTRMALQSVPPAGTPYFTSHFPAATHALSDTSFTYSFTYTGLGLVLLKGTGYNYMTLGTDLLDYGFKGTGNVYLAGSPYPAEGQWLRYPAAVYYKLPLELSTTWTTSYVEVLSGSATIFGFPFAVGPDSTRHTIVYTVEAYGSLIVPGSGAQDALRIRKVDTYATKSASSSAWSTDAVRVGYMILAKNGASVQFTAVDPNGPTSGTIGVTSVQWTSATPTSVQAVSTVPGVFNLSQNYPNPFNPSTTIRFTLPSSQQVTLKVYNLLGAEVATLVNQTVEAGESSVRFDGAGLSSGMYLYKLQAGAMTQTRRMMLVK
jgi:hypothetical protein